MGKFAQWTAEKLLGPNKRTRASQFEKFEVGDGEIVFLGDSITEGGLWHEWFLHTPLRNRGIGGDTTAGVMSRMHTAVTNTPAAVFLLIGTNDLALGIPQSEIVDNVRAILQTIRTKSPATAIYLQSVMPRRAKYATKIQALNLALVSVAAEHSATWIDLWPALEGDAGVLNPDYTLDNLHLSGAGYAAWVNVLRPHLEMITTNPSPFPIREADM